MRCIVTGASGFIGRELVTRLRADGHEVAALDVTSSGAGDDITVCDLTQWHELLAAFIKHRPEAVFHLGAMISMVAEQNPQQAFNVNVGGTINLMELSRQLGVKTFVYASTVAVYGRAVTSPVGDDAPQFPVTIYGATKVSCEQFGGYYHQKFGLDFRAVRLPTITGPTRKPAGAGAFATQLLLQPALGRPYSVPIAPDTQVALMYIKDAVDALVQIANADGARLTRRAYNVSGLSVTPAQLISAVKKVIPDAKIDYQPDPKIQAMVGSWPILDQSNAVKDWGWASRYDIDSFAADFIADAVKNAKAKEKSQ